MITAIAAKKASQNSTAGRRWRRDVTVVAAAVVTATTTAATSIAVSTALMITATDDGAARSIDRARRHGIVDAVAIVMAGRFLGIVRVVVAVAAIHIDGIRIFRVQVSKNAIVVVVSVIVIGFG